MKPKSFLEKVLTVIAGEIAIVLLLLVFSLLVGP